MSFAPRRRPIIAAALVFIFVAGAFAQTTAFTYQGKLLESGNPANGQRDFQFKLFDALNGGAQQGATLTLNSVAVSNGIFTVNLDFGSNFPGDNRFLEISVKLTGDPAYTTLAPRQPVTSTPYSVRSLAATIADGLSVTCINCVTSSQIQSVQGSQVTGPIPVASVPAGSGNYIQNTTGQQATSNFNISGNGTAGGTLTGNIVSATTQYNIGASRMLSNAGTNNTFVGINAGQNNAGSSNTFVGTGAGVTNTTGAGNAFFGNAAGLSNTTGGGNAFFGNGAGLLNTSGLNNAFFGAQAGQSDTTGGSNSFFGYQAGFSTTTSGNNSFFGTFAGLFNSTGTNNTFVGMNAGRANATSSNNAFFGSGAGQANTGAQNSFFGRSAGQANTGGASNSFFGFNAGLANTTGGNNSFFGQNAGAANTTGIHNSFFGDSAGAANTASFNAFFGDSAGLNNTTGTANAFFGRAAGQSNTTATDNSFFGFNAGLSNTAGQNSFFGRSAGAANTSGVGNSFFGYNAGVANTTGSNNSFLGQNAGGSNTTGTHNAFFGDSAGSTNTTGTNNTFIGSGSGAFGEFYDHATAIGADTIVIGSNMIQLGRDGVSKDFVRVPGSMVILGNLDVLSFFSVGILTPGSTPLCVDQNNVLSTCASSLRYKTDVTPYPGGLSILKRLHPVTFTWKADGKRDVGLGAEHVAKVEPLFTFTNAKGEIEGVKYDHLSVVFINAIKEQQAQIKSQQVQLARQRSEIEVLKSLVCAGHLNASVCRAARPSKSRHKQQ